MPTTITGLSSVTCANQTDVRSSSSNSSTTGTAMSVTAPTGTTSGDLVVVLIHANQNTTTADNNGSTPFTKDLSDYQPSNPATYGHTMAVYSRRIVLGDPSTYNFTLGATGRWSIIAITIKNPNINTIYDVVPATSWSNNTDQTSWYAPDITTVYGNAIHISMAGVDDGTATVTGNPAGYTALQNTTNQPMGSAYKIITTPAATGQTTHTFSVGSDCIGVSVAIRSSSITMVI